MIDVAIWTVGLLTVFILSARWNRRWSYLFQLIKSEEPEAWSQLSIMEKTFGAIWLRDFDDDYWAQIKSAKVLEARQHCRRASYLPLALWLAMLVYLAL